MPDVVCLGEALVDLVPTTRAGPAEATHYVKAAGGAPANVAVGLARLGVAVSFLGCVGADGFGVFLADTLAREGVDTAGLRTTAAAPTALAVVSLGANAERDFLFYGRPAAHDMLAPSDVDAAALGQARVLHLGSISLAAEPARSATLRALDIAGAAGLDVSVDANLRPALWPDPARAVDGMRLALGRATLAKLSEDEVDALAAGPTLLDRARSLWHPGLRLMAVTRGARGCLWLTADDHGEQPGFAVDSVDATGAGDAFTAALLAGLLREASPPGGGRLDGARVAGLVAAACAAGALATTRPGAMTALPTRRELDLFRGSNRADPNRPAPSVTV